MRASPPLITGAPSNDKKRTTMILIKLTKESQRRYGRLALLPLDRQPRAGTQLHAR
jgi:hypothetical protein